MIYGMCANVSKHSYFNNNSNERNKIALLLYSRRGKSGYAVQRCIASFPQLQITVTLQQKQKLHKIFMRASNLDF